ncbi:hypothetical protein [Streptomyces sp. NPDC048638]|uniref:hypothetical protein n=1 Tax=Streptomyces sp. NPDC048638 TaxID=3365580 RepID=UPI0037196EE6
MLLYERIFSAAHILLFVAAGLLLDVAWHVAAHQDAPLWARICASVAAAYWVWPIEAALARRHARRAARHS